MLTVTLLMRRVLIYLEAAALSRPKPAFAAHLTQALLAAAVSLGLRSLVVCPWADHHHLRFVAVHEEHHVRPRVLQHSSRHIT